MRSVLIRITKTLGIDDNENKI